MDEKTHPDLEFRESYQKEYDIVATSWRFYVYLRFIVVAFAITLQSALFGLYRQPVLQGEEIFVDPTTIPWVGIFTITGILFIEQRTVALLRLMQQRGVELEYYLGIPNAHFKRLSDPELVYPKGFRGLSTHTVGIALIYLVIYVLWIVFLVIGVLR